MTQEQALEAARQLAAKMGSACYVYKEAFGWYIGDSLPDDRTEFWIVGPDGNARHRPPMKNASTAPTTCRDGDPTHDWEKVIEGDRYFFKCRKCEVQVEMEDESVIRPDRPYMRENMTDASGVSRGSDAYGTVVPKPRVENNGPRGWEVAKQMGVTHPKDLPFDQPNVHGCNGCDVVREPLNADGYCRSCAQSQGPFENVIPVRENKLEAGDLCPMCESQGITAPHVLRPSPADGLLSCPFCGWDVGLTRTRVNVMSAAEKRAANVAKGAAIYGGELKNSYGSLLIEEDLRSGVSPSEVVRRLMERYSDMSREQCERIVDKIGRGESTTRQDWIPDKKGLPEGGYS